MIARIYQYYVTGSDRNENLNLLHWIKFIFIYIVVQNKNWKIYWSEQSFAGLGLEDRCSSWGLQDIHNVVMSLWCVDIYLRYIAYIRLIVNCLFIVYFIFQLYCCDQDLQVLRQKLQSTGIYRYMYRYMLWSLLTISQ